MTKFLRVLLNVCFPMREDAVIVADLSKRELLTLLNPRPHKNCIALLPFGDMRVRACVHEMKYHKNLAAAAQLQHALNEYLTSKKYDHIIPIPLSEKRKSERGYNQVELVLTENLRKATDIIYKHKDTAPQTTLHRNDRIKNVQNAFTLYDMEEARKKIKGAHIIILDDVTTTGATLQAAKATLSPHSPASITLLALSH